MKGKKMLNFYDCLKACSDEQVLALRDFLHSRAIGLEDRRLGCIDQDCFDAYRMVLIEMDRRGLYEGRLV